ncbi:NAD(P)-binding domain-containing protein, partial [Cynara cardunculus var. scolymus]
MDFEEGDWNYIFRTNLTGSWLVAKHVCINMRKAKQGGSVINISSIAVMAMELGINNIRVNCINPGIFGTEITQGLVDKDWFNNVTLRTVPLKTLGTINPALTSLALYLIHDSSV